MVDANYENEIDREHLEDEEETNKPNHYDVMTWGSDIPCREISTRWQENQYKVPKMQRLFVWDHITASKYIETLLLGLPSPSVFLAFLHNDPRLIIVDGLQRLTTIHYFLSGEKVLIDKKKQIKQSECGEVFKLADNKAIDQRWRGKSFNDLDLNDRDRLQLTNINGIMFRQINPTNNKDSLYEIFERINTSGTPLNAQEVRNCIYDETSVHNLLEEANQLPDWRHIYGSVSPRMEDKELILRYFAILNLFKKGHERSSIPLKSYLNHFMDENTDMKGKVHQENKIVFLEKSLKDFIINFEKTVNTLSGLEQKIFHGKGSKIRPTVFDAVMVATTIAVEQNVKIPPNIEERIRSLQEDTAFEVCTLVRTTEVRKILGRIIRASKIVYEYDPTEHYLNWAEDQSYYKDILEDMSEICAQSRQNTRTI